MQLSVFSNFHNEAWRLYENEIAQHAREHLVRKFQGRDGQSKGYGPPTLPKFPIHSSSDAPIQTFHNETCNSKMNEVDQHDSANLHTKFEIRDEESQGYSY
ncbi:predicted protein [Lichtheimia corymbifera JMRC:FSU:9682]|uniref:Uncharacterized protein n=1 Tax=Lichtheimia corymbifera JMRC:FSU:9682 TaxID=1263082 RepID=A0A068RPC3_9FUNG|nr:predicted protein [Lichtheimia corymbifera JMRC:FSU:9682]